MDLPRDGFTGAQPDLFQDRQIVAEPGRRTKQPGRLIPQHDGAQIGRLEHAANREHDGVEKLGEVERRGEGLGDLGQGFEFVGLALAIHVHRDNHGNPQRGFGAVSL
jgi:hypothetical protein